MFSRRDKVRFDSEQGSSGWVESGRSVLFYVPVDVEDLGSLVPRAARAHFCQ